MADEESSVFIERLKAGDPAAEHELVQRFLTRLLALAESRQSPLLRARYGPEDVVQSALASFFSRVQDGRLAPERNRSCSLLAKITLNKAAKAANTHTSDLRSVNKEEHYASADGLTRTLYSKLDDGPGESECAMFWECRERLLDRFERVDLDVVSLRLEGRSVSEISKDVTRARHQVRYVLNKAKQLLESWARESAQG